MKDESALAEHTPRPGSSSHYVQVFTPSERREGTLALYALHRAIDAACEGSDPGVVRLKLQWWQEELQRLGRGEPRHPVTRVLAQPPEARPIDLQGLVVARERELSHAGWESWASFQEAALLGVGQALESWSRLLGNPPGTASHPGAQSLALGLHLYSALQRIHRMARRGYQTLPQEWLDEAGVTTAQLGETVPHPPVRRLLAETADHAIERLQQAASDWPAEQRRSLSPLLINAELRKRALMLQRAEGYQRLDQRVTATPLRKLWCAWRVHRRCRA